MSKVQTNWKLAVSSVNKVRANFRHHKHKGWFHQKLIWGTWQAGTYLLLASRHENCKIISRLYLQRDVIPILAMGRATFKLVCGAAAQRSFLLNMLMFIPIHLPQNNGMRNMSFNWIDTDIPRFGPPLSGLVSWDLYGVGHLCDKL